MLPEFHRKLGTLSFFKMLGKHSDLDSSIEWNVWALEPRRSVGDELADG